MSGRPPRRLPRRLTDGQSLRRSLRRSLGPRVRILVAILGVLGGVLGGAGWSVPAYAAESSIDHVQADRGEIQVVLSLSDLASGASPEVGGTSVTFDGETVPAEAQLLSQTDGAVRRVTVLAMDVSISMSGPRFEQAKAAARVFLDNVPDDVAVGLVTFAGDVEVAQAPTRNLDLVRDALASLTLSRQTRLYAGLTRAVEVSGTEGARSVLVLSDGRDTSRTPVTDAIDAVRGTGVKVDVVALAQSPADAVLLDRIADAGNGRVLNADDPGALSALFAGEAAALARQVLVTVTPPEDLAGSEGTLAVSLDVDGSTATDEAFVTLPEPRRAAREQADAAPAELPVAPPVPADPGLMVPTDWMYAGLGAATVAVVVILLVALGGFGRRGPDAVDLSIEAYTRKGAVRLAQAGQEQQAGSASVTRQAVAVAESVLQGRQGLEATLGARLEAAGLALKPAEWLIVHVGIALGLGLTGLLLGGGSVLPMALALLLGSVAPWVYLSLKKRRRLKAFQAQLADTLQLMAGSLSAGLSLAQSVDTVVREGADPMAAEFRRAIMETRLGVEIEDALSGVADRMDSVDFEWVVMAIRIQREVGGNLSELLNKVADTIREREYLLRQVKTLSAEGRLSVWILGGLPPGFLAYLAVANRYYVEPLFTDPKGWVMLVVMSVLLAVGIFWMKKVVKVEV